MKKEKQTITKSELLAYEKEHGTFYTINLLWLIPPDRFDGDWEETMEELEGRMEA